MVLRDCCTFRCVSLRGLFFAVFVAVLGLATLSSVNAQLCNTAPSSTNPPCALTAGYAGPTNVSTFDKSFFNGRQAVNPYEAHFTQTTLPGSTTAAIFLEVDDQAAQIAPNITSPTSTSNPIMAQPLYVVGISVVSPANTANCNSNTTCNMVIAVTLNDTVFAWNADATSTSSALLWSRQGVPGSTSNPPGNAGNALWYDDCGSNGGPVPRTDVLQFEGILSTPVIDASGTTPVMFLTSYCQTSDGKDQWWLHEINLTKGADVVTHRHIGGTGDFSSLTEAWQQQRSALLQVKNSGNTTTPNLIYLLFGTGVKENVYPSDYSGWVVTYKSTSSALTPEFAYSNEQTGCGTGGGVVPNPSPPPDFLNNGQCNTSLGNPSCDCYLSSSTQNTPNWGGHGGGCWQSGNGAAATAVNAVNSDDAVHVFLGCGNGGFNQFTGSTPNNYGTTEMDFRLRTGTGGFDPSPFQTFTPNSPAYGVGPLLPSTCNCHSDGTGCAACTLTLQALNAYDYDFGVGGQALFNDLAGTLRLVTPDKAGYGYLFTPGTLCGSGTTTACVGFGSGDPGSLMTFGAAKTLCSAASLPPGPNNPAPTSNCDRITSMAVYDNQGTGSGRKVHLIYWPYNERLTEVQVSDNLTAAMGTGTLTWSGGGSKTLSLPACTGANCACTANQNCLGDQIVPGDTLALSGCTCVGGTCPTVTTVTDASDGSASSLTINKTISNAYSGVGCTSGQGFTYTGWIVTPAHDSTPILAAGGYPGAAVTVSVNCISPPCTSTSALIWALLPGSDSVPDQQTRGLGILYAYKALPNSQDQLAQLWSSSDTWCASSFARPTVVNGSVYVPTYAVSHGSRVFSSCPTSATSGDPYPSGLKVYR